MKIAPLPRRLMVIAAAALPFLPTLRARFVYDDTTIIRDNALLRGWGALWRVWPTPYWPSDGANALGLYRPLQLALLAIVWNIGGGSARWFHGYALVLSVLTALAVWRLIRRGVSAVPALIAVAWFASHPLHVEAIASVANTSELVVVLCTMALVEVLRKNPVKVGTVFRDNGRLFLASILGAAALLAKESGLLAIPLAVLTAWAWIPTGGPSGPLADWLKKRGRVLAAAVVGVAAALLARLVVLGAPIANASIAAQGIGELAGFDRVVAMISLWPRVLGMLLWPVQLAPYYGPTLFPAHRWAAATLGLSMAGALLIMSVMLYRKGDRRGLVAAGWIVLTYLPASNLFTPTGQILSDRTLFGATAGGALILAVLIDKVSGAARKGIAWLSVLLICNNIHLSTNYSGAWTSHRALWARLAQVEPNEHLTYKLLGMDARARGDLPQARASLGRALALAPSDRQIRFEYGQALYSSGQFDACVKALAPLLRDTDVRSEPGFIALYLDAVGRSAGPRAVVAAAMPLRHSNSAAVALLFAGVAHEQLGERALAESVYVEGLRRSPADTMLAMRLKNLRQ